MRKDIKQKGLVLAALFLSAVLSAAFASLAQEDSGGKESAYSFEMLEKAVRKHGSALLKQAEDTNTEPERAEHTDTKPEGTEDTDSEQERAELTDTEQERAELTDSEQENPNGVLDALPLADTVAISANVALSGSGTGYHAKLVIGTADAAVSFGLQYDEYAISPYAGCTAFLVENVLSDAEQQYTRFAYDESVYALQYAPYNLTLAVSANTGKVCVYVFDQLVGTVNNPNLVGKQLYAWVEGAARVRGDSVTAEFGKVRVLENGEINNHPQVSFVQMADGIYTDIAVNSQPTSILVSGKLLSLDPGYDWDSAPTSVNGYVRFY